MNAQQLYQWQQDVQACPKVYGVFEHDEGHLVAVYDTLEAAQCHVDGNPTARTIHGLVKQPYVRAIPLRTLDIAQRQWGRA